MARFVRTQTIEHPIGADGRLSVGVTAADLRLRAVPGDTVRAVATFEFSAASDDDADRQFADIQLQVETLDAELRLSEWDSARGFPGLKRLLRQTKVQLDLEVDAPPGTRLDAESVSGDIVASGFTGGQRYQTVSGDIRATGVGGVISVEAVSGDVRIDADSALALRAQTVSGDLRLEAPTWVEVRATTVSGDVELDGQFDPSHGHGVDTVSGDLRLAVAGGATISIHGLSTDISAALAHRSEGPKDRRRLVIGDGAAQFAFNSMSGDISVTRSLRAANGPPDETQPAMSELDILQALEAGAIDVDEASRLLDRARR